MTVQQNNSLKKNKFIRRFMVLLAIITIGLVLLHSYLNSDNFRANLKHILTAQLEGILGKKIEIASIDSISIHSIHLTGLKILEKDKDGAEILFQSEGAEIKFFIILPFGQEGEKWGLNIKEITFIEANTALTRDSEGDFDLAKKFQLDLESLHENISIEQISFKNSLLLYKDESVYHKDYITVETRNLNGSFDLTHLPEVKFEMRAIQIPDETPLSLSGFFFVGKTEYSLDFHLQNGDITHFQYYLEVAEQFNINKGKFDLELNLSHSPEWDSDVPFWQGEATFYEADIRPYLLKEIPFQRINGSVNFSKPEITISNLTGFHYDRPVRLEGQVWTAPETSYNLNIEGKQLNASLLKDDVSLFTGDNYDFTLEGDVDLWGNINGLKDAFSFQGKLSSSEITIEKTPFSTISGNFALNNDGLIISELESRDSNGSILINGELDWSTELSYYRFMVNTSELSLHHSLFKQFSTLQEFSGNMESKFQIESRKADSSKSNLKGIFSIAQIRREEFALPDPLKGNIEAIIDLSDNTFSIKKCELQSGQSSGSINGDIRFLELVNFMLNFEYQIPDLATYSDLLPPELNISGGMNLQGKAAGDIHQPVVALDLNFSEFSIQDHRAEELTSKLAYEKDILSIESFSLISQDLKVTAEGKITFSPMAQPEINISYQLSSLAINPLLELIDYQIPLSGFVDGHGDIQGIWPDLKAKGIFQLKEIVYQNYPLGQGEVKYSLEPDRAIVSDTENQARDIDNFLGRIGQYYSLNLEHFQLQNEMFDLNAKGEVKMGEGLPFSLDIEFSHQEFNEMVEHFYPEGESINRFLPPRITGKVACNGNSDEQKILLTSLLIPEQGESNTTSRLEAMLTLNQDGLEISDFQLIQSEGSLKAEGMIAPDRSLDINFQANQLDLANLIASLAIDEKIEGIMDIEGLCSGTLEQPTISIIVKIEEGHFREFKFENLSSELIWNSLISLVAIKELHIVLEKEYHITARGNIPVKSLVNTIGKDIDSTSSYSEIPLDFQINMDKVDLNLLKVFWKDAFSEITGIVDLEIYLTGTAGNPVMNGTIGIHQGMAHLVGFPVQIGEINNTINIINNRVTIPAIPFIVYENRFSLSGGLELVRFLPDNLSLIIKNEERKIAYQNILESEVDLELVISNSILSPQINGQILLSNGILNVNNLLKMGEDMNLSFYSPIADNNSSQQLDVNIELLDPFKLKMNNAEIEIIGKIILNGSLLNPTPNGTLALKKGYFIYFDKRFTILDGIVTINGINPDNIELNARANTHVQGIQINISILGNLLDPQILLSSQPALKETEILSLLAFDRNIEGLSEGEINQLLSQEMVNIIFQSLQINLFRRFEREIAEGLGLEFLRISFDNHKNDSSYFFLEDLHLSDLTLEVGKSIGDDVLITYSTPLDFHGEASLTLDYKLSPGFSFSTQLENFSLREENYKIKFGLEFRF